MPAEPAALAMFPLESTLLPNEDLSLPSSGTSKTA